MIERTDPEHRGKGYALAAGDEALRREPRDDVHGAVRRAVEEEILREEALFLGDRGVALEPLFGRHRIQPFTEKVVLERRVQVVARQQQKNRGNGDLNSVALHGLLEKIGGK